MKVLFISLLFLLVTFGITYSNINKNFSYSYENETERVESPKALWRLASFDGVHYLSIAQFGYNARYQTAFFPVYPTAISILSLVTHNYLFSGFLISLVSFISSLYLIKKLFGTRSVLALVFFPTAFFLIAVYSDSLFLFLSLIALYLYRQNKLSLVTLVVAIATATRVYGILLIPMFLLLAHLDKKKFTRNQLLLMPLGILVYMTFLWLKFGNPFSFFSALGAWQKSHLILPPQTVYRYLKIFITASPLTTQYYVAILEFVALAFVIMLSLGLLLTKQYGYLLLVTLGWIVPSMTGTLQSFPRYALALFPIFSILSRSRFFLIYLVLGGITQLILLYAFSTGIFVS